MDSVNELGNLAMWSLIVGFLSPLVISVLEQSVWTDRVRAFVAFLFCALVAIPTAYFAGDLQGKDYVTAGLLILVTAISTYRNFWRPSRIAPAIERATSPATYRLAA